MAKLNSILGELRGKLGGMVFTVNRFGQIVRQKISPVNPASTRQNKSRSSFANRSITWRDVLTQSQRDLWTQYADGTPLVDVFGNPKTLTGHQFFIRVNTLKYLAGAPLVLTPPVTPGLATIQDQGIFESALELLDENSDPEFDCIKIDTSAITAEPGWQAVTNYDSLLFYIDAFPRSPGSLYDQNLRYYVGSLVGNAVMPPNGIQYINLDFAIKNGTIRNVYYRRVDATGKTTATYSVRLVGTNEAP